MKEKLDLYVQHLEKQLKAVDKEIAIKMGTKSKIERKLKDPLEYFADDMRRGAKKTLAALGAEKSPETKKVLKQKLEASVPAAPPRPTIMEQIETEEKKLKEEKAAKKSSWSLFP